MAQSANAQRVVTLSQAQARVIPQQIAVIKPGNFPVESLIEKKLARSGFQEIGSAYHFRNPHGVVVSNTGELVSGNVVSAPDYKIPKVSAGFVALRPEVEVAEGGFPATGHAKSPVHSPRSCVIRCIIS